MVTTKTKIYTGTRSKGQSRVTAAGQSLRMTAFASRLSPTGYGWGYHGSDAHALAHSLLADAVDLATADRLYERFSGSQLLVFDRDSAWELTAAAIAAWCAERSGT